MPQNIKPSEISDVLLRQLKEIDTSLKFEEVGEVLQVSDGVVRIYGLINAEANELLEFENGIMAVVMNLEEDNVGAVLLGPTDQIKEGMTVRRTGRIASINVGENMLGRVVDPLGVPLDGRGKIGGELTEMPLERKAPGVIFRQPVTEPLQTGLKAIDAMIPIGRGQRELIIGDRQTGKTAIAIDTIINQRENYLAGKPVYCIYVAVGQKGSTVANIVNTLREKGAMDYTVVVAATAADPAALQYFAPFAGAAIGEYFRDTGRHALVVYDDLSKQAVAYREVSLILRRPSGREAYPGDIFYLHSRLLERAAKIIDQQEIPCGGQLGVQLGLSAAASLFDPSSSSGQIIYDHCVCSTKMLGYGDPRVSEYYIRSHAEDQQGASVQAMLPLNLPVTTFKFCTDRQALALHTGTAVGNVGLDRGCRTKLAASSQIRNIMKNWNYDVFAWHRVTVYGDWRDKLLNLARMKGLAVTEEDRDQQQ